MFCVDASVLTSAFIETEPHSQRSKEFLSKARDGDIKIFLPEIAVVEVTSGIFRATKREDLALKFLGAVRAASNFNFVAVDQRLANRASGVVTITELRGADAIYVALAMAYGITLITLDRDQLRKAKKLIQVKEP